ELAQSSMALALLLREKGIVAGDVVAVTGSRSFAVVSAMLGVFRGGGVLLTLDPKLPIERRKVMLEQSAAKLLLAAGLGGKGQELAEIAGVELVEVDPAAGVPAGFVAPEGASSSLPAIDPASPAYVFFTSGSTGVPKAVKGKHHGLAHFLAWQRTT